MKTYLSRHFQVLFSTLGDMRRTPVASLTTVAIIGVSVLLPVLLYIVIKSGFELTNDWQGQPQFSVFLQQDLGPQEAQLIYDELRLHPAIQLAEYISPEAAMNEFRTLSGLDFELDILEGNPLPASIVALPIESYYESAKLDQLRLELSKIDGIDDIRMDLEWTDRFNAILTTLSRATMTISGLLIIALILVVSTTIKLLIMNRRQEIEITKLVGGSNSFVRRPFLYFGFFFGLFGGALALALLSLVNSLMTPALTELAGLYQRDSLLYQLTWQEITLLLTGCGALGWFAARLSVAQHLNQVRPK